MKTCLETETVINDLIPGSKVECVEIARIARHRPQYKFRVMAASIAGISEASPESEEVMIGSAPEDELFDLPRGRQARRTGARPGKAAGLDRTSLDRWPVRALSTSRLRSLGPRGSLCAASPDASRRHVSLDREVAGCHPTSTLRLLGVLRQ
jgi:hypothetical protein